MTPPRFYFMGVDPAPAQTKTADDGAIVIGRARPRMMGNYSFGMEHGTDPAAMGKSGHPSPRPSPQGEGGETPVLTSSPADWIFEYVWAYRVRKADPREWSGLIHAKHQQFKLTRLCLDPQGGGYGIMNLLNKSRQLINQSETLCTPICSVNDEGVVMGDFILTLFKQSDPGIKALWPLLAGSDVLVDVMHVAYQMALDHGQIALPPKFEETPEEIRKNFTPEQEWASRLLTLMGRQLTNIRVATKENGSWDMTSRNARRFSAIGLKDIAYAGIYAYVAFLSWLKTNGEEFDLDQQGDAMFSVL